MGNCQCLCAYALAISPHLQSICIACGFIAHELRCVPRSGPPLMASTVMNVQNYSHTQSHAYKQSRRS